MKKQTFIVGALILTIGGFIAKVIGAFYKIPLTNALGSAGMGLYYLVFPLYSLLLVFSSSGVSIAVSKLVSESRANKLKRNETTYFKAGLLISFLSSLVFSCVLIVFNHQIAIWQGNVLASKGYLAIAPALISASLISVVKGYFQGVENMFPSSVAIIFEQIFKLIVGLFLAYKFLNKGIDYAVMGSILAVSISEMVTLIIMLANYIFHKIHNDYKFYTKDEETLKLKEIKIVAKVVKSGKYKLGKIKKIRRRPVIVFNMENKKKFVKIKVLYFNSSNKNITFNTAIKNTLKILVPTTLSSLVIPVMTLIDSFLVINILVKSGVPSYTATSLYGLSNGVVSALVSLPVIVTSALATSMMPNLSGLYSVGRIIDTTKRSEFYIKITFVLVLPMFVFFLMYSQNLITTLYNFKENAVLNEVAYASKLLIVASVGIIYNAFLSTLVSIMQVVGKSFKVFYIMVVAMIVRVVVAILLLKTSQINIFGIIIGNILFYSICDVVCVIEIKKTLNLSFDVKKCFVVPVVSACFSALACYGVKSLLLGINKWLYLAINGIVCIVVYLIALKLLKCFTQSEKRYFPFKKKSITKNTKSV